MNETNCCDHENSGEQGLASYASRAHTNDGFSHSIGGGECRWHSARKRHFFDWSFAEDDGWQPCSFKKSLSDGISFADLNRP